MASVTIRTARGPAALRRFIDLPFRLHAGTPWIPPLKLERWVFLSRKLNAYFSHGEAEYFLAWRDGRVVGRASAQVDNAFNEFHQARWGMFGFLELEDDPEVMKALLDAAAAWLRERGCDRMVGPMDFSMNDESGILIEGHELEPMVRQPWHPPYYQRLCEEAGLEKAMDLYSWELNISNRGTTLLPVLEELDQKAREEHGVTIRKMSRRRLRREMDDFAEIYNAAWADNWGFVPYGKKDLDAYALDLQLVYTPEWFMVAEKDGETIAIAITPIDVNQVLKKMKGRILPLGWWRYLRKNRTVDRVRVGFLGVKPEYQHTGVAAALYIAHFDAAARTRQKAGEAGWILETNVAMNRGLEAMGGEIVKRYRVYERAL
jgi:GNAT superfamily N-acetyltransferase/catechol 2,3-dioxygenase-like lactoylglutathione lyase family enzyme